MTARAVTFSARNCTLNMFDLCFEPRLGLRRVVFPRRHIAIARVMQLPKGAERARCGTHGAYHMTKAQKADIIIGILCKMQKSMIICAGWQRERYICLWVQITAGSSSSPLTAEDFIAFPDSWLVISNQLTN